MERIELGLREVVEGAFSGDPAQLPRHVREKVEERIQRTAKKNAALDMDFYQSLAGKLELH